MKDVNRREQVLSVVGDTNDRFQFSSFKFAWRCVAMTLTLMLICCPDIMEDVIIICNGGCLQTHRAV